MFFLGGGFPTLILIVLSILVVLVVIYQILLDEALSTIINFS